MFENTGSIIKGLAKAIFAIMEVVVVIAVCTILFMSHGDIKTCLFAFLTAVIGCIVSLLCATVLYALGQLVDNSAKIA